MTRAADLFRRKAASVVKEKANAEAASAVPAASGAEVSDVGAAAVGRAMTAGRKQAIAAKEAAGAARLAALAAQKAAREEHERAINPNIAKTPIRREVPLRKPKVVVRIRPLASSGGHSNEGEPVSKRLASYGNGKIVLEDEMGVDYGGARAAHARTTEYTFAQAILGPESRQAEVHEAAAAELVQAVRGRLERRRGLQRSALCVRPDGHGQDSHDLRTRTVVDESSTRAVGHPAARRREHTGHDAGARGSDLVRAQLLGPRVLHEQV